MRSARLLTAPALIALAALIWAHAAGLSPAFAQDTVTVAVGDFFFCGSALPGGAGCRTAVKQGDKVLWDYTSGSAQHTVTHCGDSCDSPTSAPLFDSQPLSPAQSFTFTFDAPGTYFYRCRIHPQAMRAQVLVVPPEATVPATGPAIATATPQTRVRAPSPAPTPTSPASPPGGAGSPSSAPLAPDASPTAQVSPTAPPSPAVREGASDDGGTSAWVYVIAGLGAAAVLAGAYFAFRRLRPP